MKGTLKIWLSGLMTGLLILGAFVVVYGPIVIQPGQHIFAFRGDGLKTYFIVADHVKNDSTYLHCEGLNYPYGNHVVMSDALPLFANTIKWISTFWPGIRNHTASLMNGLLIGSFVVGGIFLYLIFHKLDIPDWMSVLGASGLILLSPQSWRIPWMPGLALAFYVPVAGYLFIRYYRSDQPVRWSLGMGLFSLTAFFLHAYMGLMVAISFMAMTALKGISERPIPSKKLLLVAVHPLIQGIIPIAFFVIFLKITDQVTDRLTTPTGLNFMSADWSSLLFRSGEHPLSKIHQQFISDTSFRMKWEGWAYLGMVSTIGLIGLLGQFIKRRMTGKRGSPLLPPALGILLTSSLVLLIIASGFPFNWHPSLEGVVDYIPYLKQFRALGRFAWFFYYMAGVTIVYWLASIFRAWRQKGYNWAAYSLLILALGWIWVEGIDLQLDVRKDIENTTNVFSKKALATSEQYQYLTRVLDQINKDAYQGIIPLPYIHFNNDIIQPPTGYQPEHLNVGLILRYHTGIPLTAHYGTRPSVSQTQASMQFFTVPWMEKSIKTDFKDQRPFLIYTLPNERLHPREQAIYQLGKTIFKNEKIELRALHWEDLWKDQTKAVIDYFLVQKDSMFQEAEWFKPDRTIPVYHEDFEWGSGTQAFYGERALQKTHSEATILLDLSILQVYPKTDFEVSFWIEASQNRMQADLYLGRKDENWNIEKVEEINEVFHSFDLKDGWLRCAFDLDIDDVEAGLILVIEGKHRNQTKLIDQLWISPKGKSVFRLSPTSGDNCLLWWNNFPVGHLPESEINGSEF